MFRFLVREGGWWLRFILVESEGAGSTKRQKIFQIDLGIANDHPVMQSNCCMLRFG
ncbi:hypothetical protein RESH_02419 [Rhodopirellula europaea SH398]|uniref:Uncharacterized protein n=1 Tax=Rhodopirellula europaea SH398 TaxID=1263868 RepID=M5S5R9_9BACT|nr:hypothetical protein RESH_02419 [Rhodopirellula europaea SH398]